MHQTCVQILDLKQRLDTGLSQTFVVGSCAKALKSRLISVVFMKPTQYWRQYYQPQ